MKTLSIKLLLGSAAVFCATVAQAINGEDWLGEGEDTLASNSANWQGGRAADSTAAMRFQNPPGRTVTFDKLYTVGNYLWVGDNHAGTCFVPATETTEEIFNPVIWQATDPTFGIQQTGGNTHFRLGDAGNQNSALQIKSGTYTTDAEAWFGKGGAKTKVVMDGGKVFSKGNFLVGAGGSTTVVELNEGVLETSGDFVMSDNASGASYLTVGSGDPTRSAKVTVPTYRWAKLTAADYGTGILTLKTGGEFHCGFLQMNAANSQVIFDGGTFVKDGDVSNTTGALFGRNQNDPYKFWVNPGSHLQVTENGGTLDIGTSATQIDMPIILAAGATSGTLVTKGAARLTLNAADGFDGTLHVTEGGVLQLKAGDTIGGLEIEDGAFVYFPAVEFTEETTTVTLLTVKGDVSALAGKVVCANADVTATVNDGTTTFVAQPLAEGAPARTYWLSGTSDNWNDAVRWSNGAPTADMEAVFLKSVLIRMNGDRTAKKITIGKGCTLTFHKSGSWPNVRAEEISGEGRMVVSSCGIVPIAEKTLKLYVNVDTDDTVAGANQDCWIEGNHDTSRVELYGTLTAEKSAVRINKAMDVYGKILIKMTSDDDNYIQNSSIKAGGSLEVVEGGKAEIRGGMSYEEGSEVLVNGALTLTANNTFSGALAGTGTVEVLTPYTFSGNNEAFAGTVNKPWKEALRFDSVTSGSPFATWNLVGDLRTSIVEGTLKFGAINYAMKDNWCAFYAEKATDLVVEIGAKEDVNSNLGTASHICYIGDNKSAVTIRKVGAGNLDMWFDQYNTIDLHEGTVSFQNNNGPSSTYTFTGGTMKLPYVPTWNFLDRIQDSTGPVSIDTDGVDIGFWQKGTINSSNTGGFTKKGEGVMTFWADLAYTGPTTVEGGSLLVKGGLEGNAGGAVTVAEGAQLKLYVDHMSFIDGMPTTVFNGTIDEESVKRVVITGKNNEFVVSAGEGVVLATSAPADNTVPNHWVGLGSDNWTTTANWSKGVPQNEQTIQIDYTARIANIQGSINLKKIIVAAGAEAQFVTRNYNTHPSLNVNAIEILGEGEATIALDHCGVQSRVGRYDTPVNLNFRMVSTTTDGWLRDLNLKGKLLGNGILRPYTVHFYGDNSEFQGKITVLDSGSRICDPAASLPNGILELAHDISFDIMEGTFKIGSLDTHEQRLWYTKTGSTAVIEVGHRNENFGRADSKYFFGPETYSAIDVPEITFKKVGTGKWTNSMKGLRHIIVEEGELALVNCPCGDLMFDNNHGYEIETLVVKAGATLSGSAGDQPIKALTLEEGAILKTTLSEVTEGEGEEAVTTVVQSAQPVVDGDVTIEGQGAIVQVDGAELVKTGDKLTLLSVTGEGHAITGTAALKEGTVLPTDPSNPNKVWRIRNKATRLELGEGTKGFVVIIQ